MKLERERTIDLDAHSSHHISVLDNKGHTHTQRMQLPWLRKSEAPASQNCSDWPLSQVSAQLQHLCDFHVALLQWYTVMKQHRARRVLSCPQARRVPGRARL
jgi:hypothetical protein